MFTNIMKKNRRDGFTILELLVIILIIGLLSLIIFVALEGAKNKSRDARIMSQIQTLRKRVDIDREVITNYYPVFMTSQQNCNYGGTHRASLHGTGFPPYGVGGEVYNTLVDIATQQNAINKSWGGFPEQYGNCANYYPNGVVIYTSAGNWGWSYVPDFAIYARTSKGYICIDSQGRNIENTSNSVIPTNTAAGLVDSSSNVACI